MWHDTSKPPRDKAADSATCNEKADNDPRSKQSDFARLGVWVNCMKELGWGKKEK